MSKEIYISTTPHETRLAIVEDDALTEIYYERENEYTLAGSIYNGRVTRVLPGMQSAFVDIGLERDAFLYITDFMEEVPDSAEFDTGSGSEPQRAPRLAAGEAPAQDRGDRGDRGGRGRRGGRDRSRGERQPDRTEQPAPVTDAYAQGSNSAQDVSSEPYAEAGSDLGEPQSGEAGTAEGSRRWRGRRGRRRGRGNGPAGQDTPQIGQAGQTGESAGLIPFADTDADSNEETLFEGGAPLDETPGYDLGASAEVSDSAQPRSGEPREGRRDRGRFDRTRRRGGGSRPDQTPDSRPESRPDQRADSRGDQRADSRGDQRAGSRGEQRFETRSEQPGGGRQRFPRGFAPSRNLYGVEESDSYGKAEPTGAPIILPGESLSKYRKPGDEPASAAPAPVAAVNVARPANLVEVAEGWDGSDVLPGETLSRRRSPEPRASQQDQRRSAPYDRGSRRREPQPIAEAPVTAHENVEHAAPKPSDLAHERPEEATPAPVETAAAESVAPIAAAPEPVEYEPVDGSASYRVDPLAPAEFRHSTPVLEPETEEPAGHAEPAEQAQRFAQDGPSLEATHTSIAHTITPAPDEVLEPLATADPASSVQPFAETEAVHESEPALAALSSGHESNEDGAPVPAHDITSLSASGEMHSHPEIADAPTTANVADPDEQEPDIFAPGEGSLSEEFLDEEEPAGTTLHASAFEELDDLDEESIEGGAELNSMLRDMSIDQITRADAQPGDDFEDFEEDDLQEDEAFEQEETQEEVALHEHDSLDSHPEQPDEYPSEPAFEQSFRSEQGAVYEPEPAHAPETDPNRQNDRGRRDRRDPRRNGGRGDRRGGQGGGDRGGRSRHSMQSTNLPAISDLLKPGQEILVQIAKEPIAKKGARITSHIALPGRFLVFMPTVNHTGVSRKIESDSERRRLKEILLSEKGDASGGFIVRTAASGATEEELRSDLRFLLNLWSDIKSRSESSKSPALIYHDLNLIERILRDQVTDTFSAIWVDSETEYERVLRFLQRFQPSLIRRVKLYSKEVPLFEQFGISEEINKALRSKVWLKSGGSIVINQTEALVAIDINTGKYVGKTARLEDTIVKTNLDAIPEIVRQIRLRDLGGIIIIDFIDMDERKNRNRVMAALEEELKNDRAPSKVLQFNDFGLVAITRKRVKQSLERTLSAPCNICQGTGMTKSPITVCNDIYVELRKMHKHLERGDVMLRVHPEVVKQLKASNARWLHEMEEMAGKTILVKSDPSLHPEQFDIH